MSTNAQDPCQNLAVSFNSFLVLPTPDSASQERAVGCIFALLSGQTKLIKFFESNLVPFCSHLKASIDSFPNLDQRDDYERLTQDARFMATHASQMESHPLFLFEEKKPPIPEDAFRGPPSQYFRSTVVNATEELFQFDFTFLDGSSFLMLVPSPIVVLLCDFLQEYARDLEDV
jgi:hypothetical protein